MNGEESLGMKFGDVISFSVLFGTMFQFLPSIAALLTIMWTMIRIYETDTFQKILKRIFG